MALARRHPCGRIASLLVTLVVVLLTGSSPAGSASVAEPPSADPRHEAWSQLIGQAAALGLPTRFLRFIAADFVTVEFEDLHAFAAEYHPADHRMVLNRALSFNEAAGTLKPLSSLPNRDLGTLYHELFHAYFDFLRSRPDSAATDPHASRLLAVAERMRACRYETVEITPVPQRKLQTETRYLSDGESWEALNETWALFVGWVVWSRLEVSRSPTLTPKNFSRWIKRLARADRDGDLVGYYEPEDPSERAMTQKRYLAPSQRISAEEARLLLETVLEFPPSKAAEAATVVHRAGGKCPAPP